MASILQKLFSNQTPVISSVEPSYLRAAAEGHGRYTVIGGYNFNGEKNYGELGPIKGYTLDYGGLRQRSWDMYLESDTAQIIFKKYTSWTIGKGLQLQSEPSERVLRQEGISIDRENWTKDVEARFELMKRSKKSDHSEMKSLNKIESIAFKNAKVGGDVLVILRYTEDYRITVQLIDGAHVVSPRYGDERWAEALSNGNRISNGIEYAANGRHVAYHVRKSGNMLRWETERVVARDPDTGMLMAYLVYGHEYRIDSDRGMPLLSVVLETIKKVERYKEATIGSAEERQKIAYFIEHQSFSTGENPLVSQTMRAFNTDPKNEPGGVDDLGNQLAERIASTTNKQTYNLPIGSAMKELTSKNELYFKDFYEKNIDVLCAACEIPPNVAMSKYDANFSASRAALKDWGNTLNVHRDDFSNQFLQPIFELFLFTEILRGRIRANGYLKARAEGNLMVLEAYHKTRYTGVPVPHIDPVKEVEAERKKLGIAGDAIPLTTVERATEALGEGESEGNIEQFANELKKSNSLGIKLPEPPAPAGVPAKKPVKKKPAV